MSDSAEEIANCPAFWNSLTEVQKAAVRTMLRAEAHGEPHAFTDGADYLVWVSVRQRYRREVVGWYRSEAEDRLSVEDRTFFDQLRALLSPDYLNGDIFIYEDYDSADPDAATFIMCGGWTISKRSTDSSYVYVLEAVVNSPGGMYEPPGVDVVEFATFNNVYQLAETIMVEDAKQKLELRAESLSLEGSNVEHAFQELRSCQR
jgi:hypothetical protein